MPTPMSDKAKGNRSESANTLAGEMSEIERTRRARRTPHRRAASRNSERPIRATLIRQYIALASSLSLSDKVKPPQKAENAAEMQPEGEIARLIALQVDEPCDAMTASPKAIETRRAAGPTR